MSPCFVVTFIWRLDVHLLLGVRVVRSVVRVLPEGGEGGLLLQGSSLRNQRKKHMNLRKQRNQNQLTHSLQKKSKFVHKENFTHSLVPNIL